MPVTEKISLTINISYNPNNRVKIFKEVDFITHEEFLIGIGNFKRRASNKLRVTSRFKDQITSVLANLGHGEWPNANNASPSLVDLKKSQPKMIPVSHDHMTSCYLHH